MFCEHILPYLIYFLLDKPLTRPIIDKHFNCFFIKHNEIEKKMRSWKINANSYQGNIVIQFFFKDINYSITRLSFSAYVYTNTQFFFLKILLILIV